MTEALFILTLIFVAYVVYSVLGSSSSRGGSATVSSPAPVAVEKPKKEEVAEIVAATATQEANKPVSAERSVNTLRDPNTGEVVTVPANYRFAKRWIKDALVAEGLLDKVYKNSDLNDENSAKVKQAMDKLKSMEKYQA